MLILPGHADAESGDRNRLRSKSMTKISLFSLGHKSVLPQKAGHDYDCTGPRTLGRLELLSFPGLSFRCSTGLLQFVIRGSAAFLLRDVVPRLTMADDPRGRDAIHESSAGSGSGQA
jgi:hypothetical protein